MRTEKKKEKKTKSTRTRNKETANISFLLLLIKEEFVKNTTASTK